MSSSPTTTQKPKSGEGASPPASASATALELTFWGVRGSIPSPGTHTQRYGGNTPCLEIRFGREVCIFDLGSGARPLGDSLRGTALEAHIFLTHYHYDHLQGLPFFKPLYDTRNRLSVYGPSRNGASVREILVGQMVQPYFPVTAESAFRARIEYGAFEGGQRLEIGDAIISAIELNHPGGNLGYRIERHGKSIVYATDVEHGSALDERLYAFARGADLLVYDSMYTDAEYAGEDGRGRTGWGHSTWQAAIRVAQAAEVKTLVLFHHDPSRNDSEIDSILGEVRKTLPSAEAARESMVLRV